MLSVFNNSRKFLKHKLGGSRRGSFYRAFSTSGTEAVQATVDITGNTDDKKQGKEEDSEWAYNEWNGVAPWGRWERTSQGYSWRPRNKRDDYEPTRRPDSDKSLLAELDRLHLDNKLKVGMKFITTKGTVVSILDKDDTRGPKFESLEPLTSETARTYNILSENVRHFDASKDVMPPLQEYSYFDHEFISDAEYPAHQFVDDSHPDFDPDIDPYVSYSNQDDVDMNLAHDEFDDWILVSINPYWVEQFCGKWYSEKIDQWMVDRQEFFNCHQEEMATLVINPAERPGVQRASVLKTYQTNFKMDRMPPPLPEGAELPVNTFITPDLGLELDTFGGSIKELAGGWLLGDDDQIMTKTDIMFEDAAARRLLLSKKSVKLPNGEVVHDVPAYAELVSTAEKLAHDEYLKLQWTYNATMYEASQTEFYARHSDMNCPGQGAHESGVFPENELLESHLDKYDDEELPLEESLGCWHHRTEPHPFLTESTEGKPLKYRPFYDDLHQEKETTSSDSDLESNDEAGDVEGIVAGNLSEPPAKSSVATFSDSDEEERQEIMSKMKIEGDTSDGNESTRGTMKSDASKHRMGKYNCYGFNEKGEYELHPRLQEALGKRYEHMSNEERIAVFEAQLEDYDNQVADAVGFGDPNGGGIPGGDWPIFAPSEYTAPITPLIQKYRKIMSGGEGVKQLNFYTPSSHRDGLVSRGEDAKGVPYNNPFDRTINEEWSIPENPRHLGDAPVYMTPHEYGWIYQEELLLGSPHVRAFRRDYEAYNLLHNDYIRNFVKSKNLAPPMLDMQLDTVHLMDQIDVDNGERGWFGRLDMDNEGYQDIPFEERREPEKGANMVKSPLVLEKERDDIFALYAADPIKWSSVSLAKQFGRSRDRIESILVLKSREKSKKEAGMYDEKLANLLGEVWAGEFMYTNPGGYRNEGGFENSVFVAEEARENDYLKRKVRTQFNLEPKKTKNHTPPRRGTPIPKEPLPNLVEGSDLKQRRYKLAVKDITPNGSDGSRKVCKVGNPVLMRDEHGVLRPATAQEKLSRSWINSREKAKRRSDYLINRSAYTMHDSQEAVDEFKKKLREAINYTGQLPSK